MASPTYVRVPSTEKYDMEEPFLSPSESDSGEPVILRHAPRRSWLWPILAHISIATVYMIMLGAVLTWYFPRHDRGHPAVNAPLDPLEFAPARASLTYGPASFETEYEGNPFAGDPRPEHEEAWNNLLRNPDIRVTEEELARTGQTSLPLRDGGYVVQLAVYHQLHCVKWIRQWMHRDHYWPELHGVMLEERRRHIEHCLEMFRHGAMCRPSLTLNTFHWFGSHPTPELVHNATCVNWDRFQEWKSERTISLHDLSILSDERPPREDWEPDLPVILGQVKGDPTQVAKYEQALISAEPVLSTALDHPPIATKAP